MKILNRSYFSCRILIIKRINLLIKSKKVKKIIIPGGKSLNYIIKFLLKSYLYNHHVKFFLSDERITLNKKMQNSQFFRKYYKKSIKEKKILIFNLFSVTKVKRDYLSNLGNKRATLSLLGVGVDGHVAGIFNAENNHLKKDIFSNDIGLDQLARVSISMNFFRDCKYKLAYVSRGKNLTRPYMFEIKTPLNIYNPDYIYCSR